MSDTQEIKKESHKENIHVAILGPVSAGKSTFFTC